MLYYIKGGFNLILDSEMHKGKAGIFNSIESQANLISVKMFVSLQILLSVMSIIIYYTVPELNAGIVFVVFSFVLLIVSIIELIVVKRRDGVGNMLKWMIGISFVISAIATTSTMGVGGSVLLILPLLLSIQYCSLLYSIFISVITLMGSCVPLLLTSFMSFYDLNVNKLIPGSVMKIDTTLEKAILPEYIDVAGTKVNELLAIILPVIFFVIIIAIVACVITHSIRKNILEQYRHFQNTRE